MPMYGNHGFYTIKWSRVNAFLATQRVVSFHIIVNNNKIPQPQKNVIEINKYSSKKE